MQLDIITPEKILFSASAEMVVIPGTEGDFGVLPGHAPFISTIRPGIITIDTSDGEKRMIAIIGGIAEVVPDHCTVLAETAIDCSTMTAADVRARFEAARSALAEAADEKGAQEAEKHMALNEAIKFAIGEPLFE